MPDHMDDVPTAWERLAAAEAKINRLGAERDAMVRDIKSLRVACLAASAILESYRRAVRETGSVPLMYKVDDLIDVLDATLEITATDQAPAEGESRGPIFGGKEVRDPDADLTRALAEHQAPDGAGDG